jgi:hypothetical protein
LGDEVELRIHTTADQSAVQSLLFKFQDHLK